jgi:hypothetical protein
MFGVVLGAEFPREKYFEAFNCPLLPETVYSLPRASQKLHKTNLVEPVREAFSLLAAL